MIYERYRFNNRKQEQGESISAYVTELRVIAKNCALEEITPDEILPTVWSLESEMRKYDNAFYE